MSKYCINVVREIAKYETVSVNDNSTTPEKLIENTIRYDKEHANKSLESRSDSCYTIPVNDVLQQDQTPRRN